MARTIAIEITGGIGDCVHLERVLSHLLENGYETIHVFCRADATGLYQDYPRVKAYPLDARQTLMEVCRGGAVHAQVGSAEHNIPHFHRSLQYASTICKLAGVPPLLAQNLTAPRLSVTEQEKEWGGRFFRGTGRKILFQVDAFRTSKSLPMDKANEILSELIKNGCSVAVITDDFMHIQGNRNVRHVKRLTIRQLMAVAAAADTTVAMDSAPGWISLAVGTQTLVLFGATNPLYYGYNDDKLDILYSHDTECIFCKSNSCAHRKCLSDIPTERIVGIALGTERARYGEMVGRLRARETPSWRVADSLPVMLPERLEPEKVYYDATGRMDTSRIGLLRLDGMGGTLTLSDQARKVKMAHPDASVTLIVRGYEALFQGNPYVDRIINVGAANWRNVLELYKLQFSALADLRFAVAKWHGQSYIARGFYYPELYDRFPLGQRCLGATGLHHTQLCDRQLGLDWSTVDVELYLEPGERYLDFDYAVISTGVDTVHKGMNQTKCWPHWNWLVELIDMPVVQVGTLYDMYIPGTIDRRGQTSIPELLDILRYASKLILIEGGLAHLAYAIRHKRTVVLRGPTANPLLAYPGQYQVDSYACSDCMFTRGDWYARCPMNMVNPVCMESISPERVLNAIENMV